MMQARKTVMRQSRLWTPLIALALVGSATPASDPLDIRIQQGDADRFAALFAAAKGKPTAEQLQRDYLDKGEQGVAIFTPYRIENATNLAASIAADPARYDYAIKTCLPVLPDLNRELRATYLAYRGLLPERPLPSVYVLFGAANSGGTATPVAQVIGLEILCGPGTSVEDFRTNMRAIFAHETVHSWQTEPSAKALKNLMLLQALREGVPDYLASIVTGAEPSPERDTWGRKNEAAAWAAFQKDAAIVLARKSDDFSKEKEAGAAMGRWFGNAGNAPKDMPSEAGYWVGMQIARAYVEKSTDKKAAINALIAAEDPEAILKASGYGATFSAP
jgi:hypothetical protein